MLKILMVDDEADLDFLIQQRYRRVIKKGDLHFLFARNGREALNMLSDNPDINILVTDLNMPIMNGIELLEHLKNRFPDIRRYALSAYSDQDNIQLAMDAGAQDFISKPIEFSSLEEKLGIKAS